MKRMADEAIQCLTERMKSHIDSRCASGDEVYMAAMAFRIQELEEAFAGNQKKIDEEIKKPRKAGFSFKPNQLKDDGNGVNHIFICTGQVCNLIVNYASGLCNSAFTCHISIGGSYPTKC